MSIGRTRHSVLISGALLLAGVIGAATGCGEDMTANGIDIDDGSYRGELTIYTSTDLERSGQTSFGLRAPSGIERPLFFDTDVSDLTPGTELKVWGAETPDGVRVASYRVMSPPIEESKLALRSGTKLPDRSFAFVMVDFGSGSNLTKETALANMVTDPDSTRNYYLYASYGRQNITVDVFGPLKHTAMSSCATNSVSQVAADLRNSGMVPSTYQHYLWYFGNRQSSCAWAGLASVGTASKPSKDTWYNASYGCVVLVQEPGHNFGMQHSSSIRCPGVSLANDTMTCVADEYGDIYDPMGGGCKHMNAWQKGYQGWFGGCNGVNVGSSGTFKLLPYEMRCDGPQFLQIKAPKTRMINRSGGGGVPTTETLDYYFVELRTPLDFDGTLGGSALSPRVLIHVANDIVASSKRAIHPYLIDMTPNTTSGNTRGFNDAALAVGQTFKDPAGGLSITATAVSETEATITVEMEGGTAAPTCLDNTPFVAPGPGIESCTANTATPVGMSSPGAGGSGTASGGRSGVGGMMGLGGSGTPGPGTGGGNGSGGALGSGGGGVSTGSGGMAPTLGTGGTLVIGTGGTNGTGGNAVSSGGSGGPSGAGGGRIASGKEIDRTITSGCACDTGAGSPLAPTSLTLLAFAAMELLRRGRQSTARARVPKA